MNRAERRARMERQKYRAARYYGHGSIYPVMTDPGMIGRAANTPQQCSDCCGNRRKWEGATRQERRAEVAPRVWEAYEGEPTRYADWELWEGWGGI